MDISKKYTEIGERVKARLFPELEAIKVVWLVSDKPKQKKGMITHADCTPVNKGRYEWCCDYDYMITVYENNMGYMSEHQIEILLEHELMHIDPSGKGTVPHDLEDFKKIIEKYGVDWDKEGKTWD